MSQSQPLPSMSIPGMSIHRRMAAILAELPAIGKNQRNVDQKFNFRGVDDVLNALNPLLAKYEVYYLPDVLERVDALRQTKSGTNNYVVNLHVRYTFYGPDGDSVSCSTWGEGTDMGDKATPKAMTGAQKYALFQAFCIATEEQSVTDADRHTPVETTDDPRLIEATPGQLTALRERLTAVTFALGGEYPEGYVGVPKIEHLDAMLQGERQMCALSAIQRANTLLDEIPAPASHQAPAADDPAGASKPTPGSEASAGGETRPVEGTAPVPAGSSPKQSDSRQRARFAQLCGTLQAAGKFGGADGDAIRHEMIGLITNGRTRTSTQSTFDEMSMAIRSATLMNDGWLALEQDPANREHYRFVALADDNDPSAAQATAGAVFLRELAAMHGRA